MSDIGPEHIISMREALSRFLDETKTFNEKNASQPASGSLAQKEHATYARAESLASARCMGMLLIDFGGEHLAAFVNHLSDPIKSIVCCTCVRSMLESCALSTWILDPFIGAHERVGRVFAHRYEGIVEERKLARASGQSPTELRTFDDRINEVEKEALDLGFATHRKDGRVTAIAQQKKGPTEFIKLVLNEEFMYRMLSGVAHGQFNTIRQLCYKPANTGDVDMDGVILKPFEKTINVKGIALMGDTAFKAFARALWNQCRYFGWNPLHLEELFETAADRLQINPNTRFWRS